MEKFSKLSHEDKRDFLSKIAGKKVCVTYDYSDLPDGHLGSECLVGEISTFGLSKFRFNSDKGVDMTLTIDGIESIEIL